MNTEVLITSLSNSPYRAFERLAGIELKGDPSSKGIIPTNILRVQPKPLRQEPNFTDKTAPEKTGNLGNGNETKALCVCADSTEKCNCGGGVKLRTKKTRDFHVATKT